MGYDTGPRQPRWGTLALVIGLHGAAFAGLVHAFAPDLAGQAAESAARLVAVFDPLPPPEPPPPPPAPQPAPAIATAPEPEPEGASAPPAPRATPRPVAAPSPPVTLSRITLPAPPVSAKGADPRSGAATAGEGTGGGGAGAGTGSGGAGQGQGGGGVVTRPVKVAGNINDARDYPTPPGGREVRRGHHVVIHMIVGVDGRARQCRVVEPSPDPEADRRTCQLAEDRFRFRPARNAAGEPVPAPFGWRQEWF